MNRTTGFPAEVSPDAGVPRSEPLQTQPDQPDLPDWRLRIDQAVATLRRTDPEHWHTLLAQIIHDPDPVFRHALMIAGCTHASEPGHDGNVRLYPPLLRLLSTLVHHPNPTMRWTLAHVVAHRIRHGDLDMIPLLADLVREPEDLSIQRVLAEPLLTILIRFRYPTWVERAVHTLATHNESSIRMAVVTAIDRHLPILQHSRIPPILVSMIVRFLRDPDRHIRRQIVDIIEACRSAPWVHQVFAGITYPPDLPRLLGRLALDPPPHRLLRLIETATRTEEVIWILHTIRSHVTAWTDDWWNHFGKQILTRLICFPTASIRRSATEMIPVCPYFVQCHLLPQVTDRLRDQDLQVQAAAIQTVGMLIAQGRAPSTMIDTILAVLPTVSHHGRDAWLTVMELHPSQAWSWCFASIHPWLSDPDPHTVIRVIHQLVREPGPDRESLIAPILTPNAPPNALPPAHIGGVLSALIAHDRPPLLATDSWIPAIMELILHRDQSWSHIGIRCAMMLLYYPETRPIGHHLMRQMATHPSPDIRMRFISHVRKIGLVPQVTRSLLPTLPIVSMFPVAYPVFQPIRSLILPMLIDCATDSSTAILRWYAVDTMLTWMLTAPDIGDADRTIISTWYQTVRNDPDLDIVARATLTVYGTVGPDAVPDIPESLVPVLASTIETVMIPSSERWIQAAKHIIMRWHHHPDLTIRMAVVRIVAILFPYRSRHPELWDVLRTLAHDPEVSIRYLVATMLRDHPEDGVAWMTVITTLTTDPDATVRSCADDARLAWLTQRGAIDRSIRVSPHPR